MGGKKKRTPCFSEDWIKKDKTYKTCKDEPKTPFSWWCNPSKKGGYQFLEEHVSHSTERFRRIPWQPTHLARRDDTWPYNCDPLRCANTDLPTCLHKLIHGDQVCIKKTCNKYHLKAPLWKLPANLGIIRKKPKCFFQFPPEPKPEKVKCKIHCKDQQKPLKREEEDCECTDLGNFLVQTRDFKDFCCDPPVKVHSVGDEIECPSSEFQDIEALTEQKTDERNHLLEASYSCPLKSKAINQSRRALREAFKNYRSCQELIKENRKKTSAVASSETNPFLKYLRCFDLEKETLEYIQKCFCEPKREENLSSYTRTKQEPSTKVLFSKKCDDKFEEVTSILEISQNIGRKICEDNIFTFVIEGCPPDNMDENTRNQYKNVLNQKLGCLKTVLDTTEKLKMNETEAKGQEYTNVNKKLFTEKIRLIQSIIELIEKMKAALDTNETESRIDTTKGNVDIILEKGGDMGNLSSDVTPSSRAESEKINKDNTTNTDTDLEMTASSKSDDVERNAERQNVAPVSSGRRQIRSVKGNQGFCGSIRLAVDTEGDSVEYRSEVSVPFDYRTICPNRNVRIYTCPYPYMQIDDCINCLAALITTWDPFLSPYSPTRDYVYPEPYRTVRIKKCLPIPDCLCTKMPDKLIKKDENKPISALPLRGDIYKQSHGPRICEMRKWTQNWTGRKMTFCNNTTRKKCLYGLHC